MAATQEMNLRQYADWLQSMGVSPRANWAKPIKQIRQVIIADTKQNFANQRSPDGQPWKGLQFDRVRGGNQVLRDEGILMASVTVAGKPGNVERVADDSFEWGTNLVKAALHQYGGIVRPTNTTYLAIPLTIEAKRAGRARDFPGELDPIINPKTGLGVLVEHKNRKQRQRKRRGKSVGLSLLDVVAVPVAEKDVAQFALLKEAKVPARPFLGLNDSTIGKIEAIVMDFAEDQLGGFSTRRHP